MPNFGKIAKDLEDSLKLPQTPIAVSLTDAVPDGVSTFDGNAAAGCQFWDHAAKGPIATSTEDHELCSIGVHTHQLADASERSTQELGEVLGVLADLTYVRESDVARIPVMPRPSKHVVYSPLAETPVDPEVVLLFADARRGLIIAEAVDQVDDGSPPVMGRPACAAIPQAVNTGRAVLSLGCCGARAYLDVMRDDIAMWAIPGSRVETYTERIVALANANQVLTRFHEMRSEDVAAGSRPTVKDSLARLG